MVARSTQSRRNALKLKDQDHTNLFANIVAFIDDKLPIEA